MEPEFLIGNLNAFAAHGMNCPGARPGAEVLDMMADCIAKTLIPTTALDPSLLGYCTTALTEADGGRELSGCDECGGLQRECLHACKGLRDLRTSVLDDMDLEDKWTVVRSGYRELHPEITEGDTLYQHGDIDRMLLQMAPAPARLREMSVKR